MNGGKQDKTRKNHEWRALYDDKCVKQCLAWQAGSTGGGKSMFLDAGYPCFDWISKSMYN
ncbi:MAG: hypothetical protein ACM3WS_03870 [Bacillota bacterium]